MRAIATSVEKQRRTRRVEGSIYTPVPLQEPPVVLQDSIRETEPRLASGIVRELGVSALIRHCVMYPATSRRLMKSTTHCWNNSVKLMPLVSS